MRNIKEIVLPASLKKIGSYAFDDVQFEKVTCLNLQPIECEENIFKNETYLYATLLVSQESLNLYKETKPWSSFFTIEGHTLTDVSLASQNGNTPLFYMNQDGIKKSTPYKGFNIIMYTNGERRKVIF